MPVMANPEGGGSFFFSSSGTGAIFGIELLRIRMDKSRTGRN